MTVRFVERLPKRGADLAECEDRVAYDAITDGFRVAVADGASASLCAGEWADLLVKAYTANVDDDPAALAEKIAESAADWNDLVNQRDLPWYARAKQASGAFASLVGVCINSVGSWTATAIGDSCVFQVRRKPISGGEEAGCVFAFPLSRTGQFGSTPELIGTNVLPQGRSLAANARQWVDGDDLYLMTDALAEWFLGELQQKREPWRWFDALEVQSNPISFEKLVGDLRGSGKLKDDDVTLVHLNLTHAVAVTVN